MTGPRRFIDFRGPMHLLIGLGQSVLVFHAQLFSAGLSAANGGSGPALAAAGLVPVRVSSVDWYRGALRYCPRYPSQRIDLGKRGMRSWLAGAGRDMNVMVIDQLPVAWREGGARGYSPQLAEHLPGKAVICSDAPGFPG